MCSWASVTLEDLSLRREVLEAGSVSDIESTLIPGISGVYLLGLAVLPIAGRFLEGASLCKGSPFYPMIDVIQRRWPRDNFDQGLHGFIAYETKAVASFLGAPMLVSRVLDDVRTAPLILKENYSSSMLRVLKGLNRCSCFLNICTSNQCLKVYAFWLD